MRPDMSENESSRRSDPLQRADVGLMVVRGGTVRIAGYGLGMVFAAGASVLLLRYLGVVDFGRFVTVASLVAIVSGLTDAGLSAVGARNLAVRPAGESRDRFVANLIGLRIGLTAAGVLVATGFAIAAGYGRTLVVGTVLAGLGAVLASAQTAMTLPLSVELRITRLTATEVIRQSATLLGIVALVVAGAGLAPFFAISIAVGVVVLGVTPPLVGRGFVWRPAFDGAEWLRLLRDALPLAAAVVVGVLYFRLLMVLMSLLATGKATGLFATSFRVTEMLYGLFSVVVTIALPVLAVAADERIRLRYILQRMVEIAVISSTYLVIIVLIAAEPLLSLVGGRQYRDAAPVLRVQAFALIAVFVAQVFVVAFISIGRPAVQAAGSGLALLVVLGLGFALIPLRGANGAAVAALVAEYVYAAALLILLIRCDASLRPSFRFLWKIGLASALAATLSLVPGLPTVGTVVAATVGYVIGLWVTRAVPPEVAGALSLRGRG